MLHKTYFTFGPFAENTWLFWTDDLQCMIVDPGCYTKSEQAELEGFITEHNLNPVLLINTHGHIDHILGNAFVHRKYGLTPWLNRLDLDIYQGGERYGAVWGITLETPPDPQLGLEHGSQISLGEEAFEVLFTPGHTPGEVCLVHTAQEFVIAGDVLFRMSIGRTDLPGGHHPTLIQSIQEQLFKLPDSFEVFCGHGPSTTIGFEKLNNPFLS